ncbi:hypothetical protein O0544_11150 [Edwardsiella anguillarum]|nr:hypothetical protein [Edwardsiella anguillarum]
MHQSAVDTLRAAGYNNIEYHKGRWMTMRCARRSATPTLSACARARS